jgi:hypothetical protein
VAGDPDALRQRTTHVVLERITLRGTAGGVATGGNPRNNVLLGG